LIQMGWGGHWSQPEALVLVPWERASFLGPRKPELGGSKMCHYYYSADRGCLRAQFTTPTKVQCCPWYRRSLADPILIRTGLEALMSLRQCCAGGNRAQIGKLGVSSGDPDGERVQSRRRDDVWMTLVTPERVWNSDRSPVSHDSSADESMLGQCLRRTIVWIRTPCHVLYEVDGTGDPRWSQVRSRCRDPQQNHMAGLHRSAGCRSSI
jgi:hypothetical protein